MRRIFVSGLGIIIVGLGVAAFAGDGGKEAGSCSSCVGMESKDKPATTQPAAEKQYTCPMHPEVISDNPGKCPKCGMTLVQTKPTDKAENAPEVKH